VADFSSSDVDFDVEESNRRHVGKSASWPVEEQTQKSSVVKDLENISMHGLY